MKTKLSKIAKTIAVGIFFMALFLNVKVTLEDPFLTLDSVAIAQSNSSSNGCEAGNTQDCPGGSCSYVDIFGGEPRSCCTACCPTGKSPQCGSSGCSCWG